MHCQGQLDQLIIHKQLINEHLHIDILFNFLTNTNFTSTQVVVKKRKLILGMIMLFEIVKFPDKLV